AMHPGQTTELEAAVAVPSKSAAGGTVTLAATVTGAATGATSTGSVTGSATVSVVATPPSSTSPGSGGHHSSSPRPSPSHSSGSTGTTGSSGNTGGTGTDTQPFDSLPPLNSSGGGSDSTGGDSSNLFPTITPSTPSTPGTTGGSHGKVAKPYRATTVADVLPLNSGQIGGQIAGLIVLGLGIILVFARISLRKPRSTEDKQ
ncbi:MAG: hypothetical protein ACRDNF_03115, partial [Streptosporangiaceae bacterium]